MDEETQREMCQHIHNTPHLLSCLWDMGLLPEQIKAGSDKWWFIMGIAFRDKKAETITNITHHI